MSCFLPNGQPADGLVPCNSTASASHCCRQGDVCLSNGFCFSAGLNALVRRGCTDKTFNSTECPQECSIGDNAVIPDVILTPCDTIYTFCCGQDEAARNCCDTRNGTVRLAAASAGPILVAGDTASVTVDPSSLPRVTVTSVISSTTTLLSTPSGGSATGSCKSDNKATIGVGAGLGAAFLVMAAVAAFFAYKWRETDARRRKALGLELQGATGAFAARS